MLYTAADDDAEIATYDDLLASYALDGSSSPTRTTTTPGRPGCSSATCRSRRSVDPGARTQRHSWVDVDGAAGTAAATEHLIDAGHRRIAFLGWPPGSGVGDDRRSGWATTMSADGLDIEASPGTRWTA